MLQIPRDKYSKRKQPLYISESLQCSVPFWLRPAIFQGFLYLIK
ncbi:hypothetical protein YPPY59_3607, partial [Yersinia pestis PY-59]